MKTHPILKGKIFSVLIILFLLSPFIRANNISNNRGDEEYLIVCEKMPTPIGGIESIMKKVKYPELAKKAGVQGKVYVLIYINQNGDVDDVKLVKGVGAGCDEEAIAAIKSTKFSPGMEKGSNVKTKLSLSINFKLQ